MLSDIMAESSSPSTTNNHQSQAEIEDEIVVYDDFLKVHKKPAEVETAEDLPDFVIPQMNNVPSQSQLSALSDATPPTSGKGQPPASNSTSPTPQFPTALGTTVEQPEEEDYSEDEEEEEEGVFLRIGRMTLSETQAKLYGLKKDPKKVSLQSPQWERSDDALVIAWDMTPAEACVIELTLFARAAQVRRFYLQSRGGKVQEEQAQRGEDGEDLQAGEEVQL